MRLCSSVKVFEVVPARFVVGIMMFFGCWANYMMRVNISVNIIAMVPETSNGTTVKGECAAQAAANSSALNNAEFVLKRRQPEDVQTFDWTTQQQAYVLSSYFWGYAPSHLVGGAVAERWGARKCVFIAMVIGAILTALSPQCAQIHYMFLVLNRLIIGVVSGVHFPAFHSLVARWAPPEEKGLFVSALVGGSLGTVFTWSLTGPLIENFGWDYAFYVPGALILAWSFLWWFFVHDSPLLHPRITDKEKKHIINALGDKVDHDLKYILPFKSIITSIPFIAMVILHYGNSWGIYFMMTAAPKYVSTALGFNLSYTGALSSLPYLARMIFSLLFGAIGDSITKRKLMSTTTMRKFFCIFSHLIPGALLITLGYAGCNPALSIAITTFALGFNGSATLTNLVNHQDLAPNFAATLYGIANGIGNTAGFITPLVTAYFTKDGNGFAQWRPVFFVGAALYIAAALFFFVFGTGQLQEWNTVKPQKKEKRNDSKSDQQA